MENQNINIKINIEEIEKNTGLNFANASLIEILNYINRTLENNFIWHNKNLTKQQDNAIYDVLEIINNIEKQ